VILVGEMRDLETIEAAISAAETGHLVFGTLHTNSAAKTVDRIVDAFPANMKDTSARSWPRRSSRAIRN
jgi:twitching motility protein PilT